MLGDIEMMNLDLLIRHLGKGATLNMERTVDARMGLTPRATAKPTSRSVCCRSTRAIRWSNRSLTRPKSARVGQEAKSQMLPFVEARQRTNERRVSGNRKSVPNDWDWGGS